MYWQENNGMEFDLHQDCSRLLGLVFLIASILCSIILAVPVCGPDPVAVRSDQPPGYSEATTKSRLQEVGDSFLATGTPLAIYLNQTSISINPSAISSASKPFTLAPVSEPLFPASTASPPPQTKINVPFFTIVVVKTYVSNRRFEVGGVRHCVRVGTTH